jgi:hypothetical protein
MGGIPVGIFDEAEKLAGQAGGDQVLQDVTKDAENWADQETGNKFDSEVQAAGNFADQQAEQDFLGGQQGQQDQQQ